MCKKKKPHTKKEKEEKTGQIKKINYPAGCARDLADSWKVAGRGAGAKKTNTKRGRPKKTGQSKKINNPAGSARDPADSRIVAGGLEGCRCAPLVVLRSLVALVALPSY